jgi:aspartyl-tRNA(Asn)/glutamyl-tRNA(Gln) amidotransferase subunit C
MSLSEKDVQYVARLSRLELSEEEVRQYSQQLSSILGYIEQLNKLDTGDVEPLSHVLDLRNVFRKDEVRPSLPQKDILANGPETAVGHFRVPKIQS